MVSFVLQDRMARLERIVLRRVLSAPPKKWLDYSDWPEERQARFVDLFEWRELGLTDAAAAELYAFFADCDVVQASEDEEDGGPQDEAEDEEDGGPQDEAEDEEEYDGGGAPEEGHDNEENEDNDEDGEEGEDEEDECLTGTVVEWDPDELAIIIAFHEFARLHPSISLPDMDDLLKEYLLDTISRLLEKYGWVVGRHDCENVLPLDKWAPEDRGIIEGIYQALAY